MSSSSIGEIQCPCCKTTGAVHRAKYGKLYWKCECGGHQPLKAAGQDWILENAMMYGPEGAPAPHEVEVEAVELKAKPAAPARVEPKPEKSSGWGTIL